MVLGWHLPCIGENKRGGLAGTVPTSRPRGREVQGQERRGQKPSSAHSANIPQHPEDL